MHLKWIAPIASVIGLSSVSMLARADSKKSDACMASAPAVPSGPPAKNVRFHGKWTCTVTGSHSGTATIIFLPGDAGKVDASLNMYFKGRSSETATVPTEQHGASLVYAASGGGATTHFLFKHADATTIRTDYATYDDKGGCVKDLWACTPAK